MKPLPFSPAVVGDLANKMLGFNLITKQTPKDGVKVKTVSQSFCEYDLVSGQFYSSDSLL